MNKLNMNIPVGNNNTFKTMPDNFQIPAYPLQHPSLTQESQNYNARVFLPPGESFPDSINTSHYTEAVKGIQEKGRVNCSFFDRVNINNIHRNIQNKVRERIGEVISRQDDAQLHIIMRSIFLQHGREESDVLGMVRKLNEKTINFSVDEIIKNILQYRGYLNDISRPRTIMSHGVPTTRGHYSNSLSDRNDIF
tara:strand:- start:3123 stop:3704 length:582 start_codon:yes stop_codon:yes gene_type:complete